MVPLVSVVPLVPVVPVVPLVHMVPLLPVVPQVPLVTRSIIPSLQSYTLRQCSLQTAYMHATIIMVITKQQS